MLFDGMSDDMVKAMIETMPAEISVINAKDEVVGWNKHATRIFKRPMEIMGMNFRDCHPPKSLPMVEKIIGDMKSGEKDSVRFWVDMEFKPGEGKHKILIEFYALRDDKGKYLGCMEYARDIEEIRKLEGQKRLMD